MTPERPYAPRAKDVYSRDVLKLGCFDPEETEWT